MAAHLVPRTVAWTAAQMADSKADHWADLTAYYWVAEMADQSVEPMAAK